MRELFEFTQPCRLVVINEGETIMAIKLTKAQLMERIAQLESELGLRNEDITQLRREVDALYVEQRPSRRERASTDFVPTTVLTFRQRLALADAEARATGRCVRV